MITLENIQSQQKVLEQMIDQFKAEQVVPVQREFVLPATQFALAEGEHCAGLILNDGNAPDYFLILLPGEIEDATWTSAHTWAKKQQGGDLPTRREQALLYANLKKEFESAWHWSSEQDAADPDYVWMQDFNDGYQTSLHKSNEYRSRAVRRIFIKDLTTNE